MISLIIYAYVGLGCGFKPFPPLGCEDGEAYCTCNEDGYCEWVWICN